VHVFVDGFLGARADEPFLHLFLLFVFVDGSLGAWADYAFLLQKQMLTKTHLSVLGCQFIASLWIKRFMSALY
jgi:hypothetical protein